MKTKEIGVIFLQRRCGLNTTSNPGFFRNAQDALRLISFAVLGTAVGYWFLPLLAPRPVSFELKWAVWPPVMATVGLVLGVILGLRFSLSTVVAYAGAILGLGMGRFIAIIPATIINLLWYDVLQFDYPLSASVFIDFVEILFWVVLGIAGAFLGRLIFEKLLHVP